MQTQEPAEAAPGGPASEEATAATQSGTGAPTPPLVGPAPVLWGAFLAFIAIFLLGLIVVARMRAGGRAGPRRKAASTDYFQPAGDGADIVFEDENAAGAAPDAEPERPASPVPQPKRKGWFGRQKAAAAQPSAGAAAADEATVIEPEAEIAILRSDDAGDPERAEPSGRASPFSGLFSRRKRVEEPLTEFEPALAAANDGVEAEVIFERGGAAPDSARGIDEQWRLEDEALARRRAYERADAERREAEEEERREMARRAVEREAEFERRKAEAVYEQRRVSLEARERALEERERQRQAAEIHAGDADYRRADRQENMRLREIEGRIAQLADRLEERLTAEASTRGGDVVVLEERFGAIGDMIARRVSEQRDAMTAALDAIEARIGALEDAGDEERRAIRDEIAAMRRADRPASPTAPAVQLSDIVRSALAPGAFEMRALLANNRRADCLIRLPRPPGPIAVDARFPVEAFARLPAPGADGALAAETEFRRAALRHIVDIAERLIVPDATAQSAMLFVPSETMYAELHSRFPDIVQESLRAHVWIVSPTTLMATLHTIRGVLREALPRESGELAPSEALRMSAEVDALRRRIGALEETFAKDGGRARDASPGERLRREGGADGAPARRQPDAAPEAGLTAAAEDGPDLWEDRRNEEARAPFPLR